MPDLQRDAIVRLEDAAIRSAWRHHLFPAGEPAPVVRPVERTATVIERGATRGPVPLSIVIPIRDRGGADVRNSLASLVWQNAGRPAEIVLVSHGSKPAYEAELAHLAREVGATLINVGSSTDPWSKPLALNTGIRATDPTTPFVMTMDGDMILADNMFDAILAELRSNARTLVLCQSSDLPQGCDVPTDSVALRAAFASLRTRATTRPMYGTGGIQVLPRSFLFDVRGYDEDMLYWGALDTDMVRRAERGGLRVTWISDSTCMLHQWHPRKHRVLDSRDRVDAARGAWLRNHEIMLERANDIVRNREAWGAALS
jgi:cellulose synthase/poly-beta-1,6-N-acetylglucosamine synthase-like glycosyltransferase